jgi:hypothetical protein
MRAAARVVPLLAVALAACTSEEGVERLPPTDRFYNPIGVATSAVTGATGGMALFVASANYDLRYSAEEGGTLLSVDPDAPGAARDAALVDPGAPVVPLDAERMASYAGPIAVVDARTCPDAAPSVLVASRFDDVLYRYALDGATGALACGAGCRTDLGGGSPGDPFAIAVACGAGGTFQRAYVGFLDTPDTAASLDEAAFVAEVDLSGAAPPRIVEVGDGPVRSLAFEPAANRLWMAARSTGTRALLYAAVVTSAGWQAAPREAARAVDLYPYMAGVELKSIAVGTPAFGATRLYATARLYDPESQASNDARPRGDVGGVLLILDLDHVDGRPVLVGLDHRNLGTGVGDVGVVRRAGGRDVVVATVLDRDAIAIYDDATGAYWFEDWPDPTYGLPTLGDRPIALAIDQPAGGVPLPGAATIHVAGFGEHAVNRFDLNFDADASVPPTVGTLSTLGGLGP